MKHALETVLEKINAAESVCLEYQAACQTNDESLAIEHSNRLAAILEELQLIGRDDYGDNDNIKLAQMAESCAWTLARIACMQRDRTLHKIEFELYPYLQEMYLQFYFWACVFGDRAKMDHYREHELPILHRNKYIAESIETGQYKHELSILVTGYNKLEYTRKCVQSILDTVPRDLNYELILNNHGSSDGTQEYFETIKPAKQFDIKINRCGLSSAVLRVVEGKYLLGVSNDVIVLPGAIENMLRAAREDPEIGFIVPATSGIGNHQEMGIFLSDENEMKAFGLVNNVYDPYRHEQRVKLYNPLSFLPSELYLGFREIHYVGYYHSNSMALAAADDALSLHMRRAGYKNVLMKDAYCHHYGKITIQACVDEESKKSETNFYLRVQDEFKKAYGINTAGVGCRYDLELVDVLELPFENGHVDILGINCGLGSNSLKLKETYKEKLHNLDVHLTNSTSDESLLQDVKGISNTTVFASSLKDALGWKRYHHIVWELPFGEDILDPKCFRQCIRRLKRGGSLYVNIAAFQTNEAIEDLLKRYVYEINGNWCRIKKA